MRQDKQLQRKIDSFLNRKTSQYPEIGKYARDVTQIS